MTAGFIYSKVDELSGTNALFWVVMVAAAGLAVIFVVLNLIFAALRKRHVIPSDEDEIPKESLQTESPEEFYEAVAGVWEDSELTAAARELDDEEPGFLETASVLQENAALLEEELYRTNSQQQDYPAEEVDLAEVVALARRGIRGEEPGGGYARKLEPIVEDAPVAAEETGADEERAPAFVWQEQPCAEQGEEAVFAAEFAAGGAEEEDITEPVAVFEEELIAVFPAAEEFVGDGERQEQPDAAFAEEEQTAVLPEREEEEALVFVPEEVEPAAAYAEWQDEASDVTPEESCEIQEEPDEEDWPEEEQEQPEEPLRPAPLDAERLFEKADGLRKSGYYQLAARIYAECVRQAPPELAKKADMEQLACLASAKDKENAVKHAQYLLQGAYVLTYPEQQKIQMILKMVRGR